jgi:Fic-DOC domain mobile mystery protein B
VNALFEEPDNATPLEPAEREGLIPSWVTQRSELNEVEQDNILKGDAWAKGIRGLNNKTILSIAFVRELHKRMFGEVWAWAGNFRTTERNIGINAYRIPQEISAALNDVGYWLEHNTYKSDEIAVRLNHRLVAIHPFPNGNGRHARLMADLLIKLLGGETFSWGGASIHTTGDLRAQYVSALKAADAHDITPLLVFARL